MYKEAKGILQKRSGEERYENKFLVMKRGGGFQRDEGEFGRGKKRGRGWHGWVEERGEGS